jgi:AraC family transcriptional regulator
MPEKAHASRNLRTAVAPAHVLSEARLLAEIPREWDGMYAAYAHFLAGEFALPPVNGHLLTLHLGRPVTSVRRREGRVYQGTKVHGDIEMVPSGCPGSWVYESAEESIGIILAPELVQQVAGQTVRTSPERVEIRNNFCTRDPLIEKIGLALFADLREDGVDGRLFAESAAHLLAVHLLRHYATHTYRVREYSGGLSRQKLRRVMELIHEHLEKDLKLAELAATVGVSPYHFARLFKQSTGQRPHRYVITCRIERAKHLLAHTELSIAEIAYRVGFASQSHFTTHFRKLIATTPKAYRGKL